MDISLKNHLSITASSLQIKPRGGGFRSPNRSELFPLTDGN